MTQGPLAEMVIDRSRIRHAPIQACEDTVGSVRHLARHHPDAAVAGIPDRCGKTTAFGHPFTAHRVDNLRGYRDIEGFNSVTHLEPTERRPNGECRSTCSTVSLSAFGATVAS